MIRIDTKKDDDRGNTGTRFIRCPNCNQILFDLESVKGYAEIRAMCRRCRHYIKVEIVGNEP